MGARDSDAHSVVYQDEDVYRFGFSCLLSRFKFFEENSKKNSDGKFELRSATLRPSFNVDPVTKEDWEVLHQSMDAVMHFGSDSLKNRLIVIEKILKRNPRA